MICEITTEELLKLPENSYKLLDVRSELSYGYGSIPGAENLPDPLAAAENDLLPKDRKIILFCMNGKKSPPLAEALQSRGYDVGILSGGYSSWLLSHLPDEDRSQKIESALRSRKKYKKTLFSPFAKAINRYELLQPGDRVAVCISGGKDSMLMAKLFQELQRHRKFQFDLVFLVMDPGYSRINRLLIESNARLLGIPLQIFDSPIFDTVYEIEKSPCYLCARMRRGYLYSKAQALGCNKIALGHHFDDVIETTLMGMLWGGQMQGMMPKLHSTNFPGMELIRPMYLIREDDIKAWRDDNGLQFLQCACRFTEEAGNFSEDGTSESKRLETKLLIRKLKETNPYVESNIFNSTENVSLDTLIAYKQKGVVHHFLDSYDEKPEAGV